MGTPKKKTPKKQTPIKLKQTVTIVYEPKEGEFLATIVGLPTSALVRPYPLRILFSQIDMDTFHLSPGTLLFFSKLSGKVALGMAWPSNRVMPSSNLHNNN